MSALLSLIEKLLLELMKSVKDKIHLKSWFTELLAYLNEIKTHIETAKSKDGSPAPPVSNSFLETLILDVVAMILNYVSDKVVLSATLQIIISFVLNAIHIIESGMKVENATLQTFTLEEPYISNSLKKEIQASAPVVENEKIPGQEKKKFEWKHSPNRADIRADQVTKSKSFWDNLKNKKSADLKTLKAPTDTEMDKVLNSIDRGKEKKMVHVPAGKSAKKKTGKKSKKK